MVFPPKRSHADVAVLAPVHVYEYAVYIKLYNTQNVILCTYILFDALVERNIRSTFGHQKQQCMAKSH